MKVLKKRNVDGKTIALIDRESGPTPYVVAWGYNEKREDWQQGHYFEHEDRAREYMDTEYPMSDPTKQEDYEAIVKIISGNDGFPGLLQDLLEHEEFKPIADICDGLKQTALRLCENKYQEG